MKIITAIISMYDEAGREPASLVVCDTIEHAGKRWLVPEWLRAPDETARRPTRIVHVVDAEFVPAPSNVHQADLMLPDPIPKGVLSGLIPIGEEAAFLVVDLPPILIAPPGSVH